MSCLRYARCIAGVDERRHGAHSHLLHRTRAMHFHCLLRYAKICRDLLVQATADDLSYDFPLTGCQAGMAFPDLV